MTMLHDILEFNKEFVQEKNMNHSSLQNILINVLLFYLVWILVL